METCLLPNIQYCCNDIKIGSTVAQTNSFAINLQAKARKQIRRKRHESELSRETKEVVLEKHTRVGRHISDY